MKRISSLILWTGALAALLSMTSCRTLTELAVVGLAEAVTGKDIDRGTPAVDAAGRGVQAAVDQRDRDAPRDDGGRTASVYQMGPTPEWERGFRTRASVASSYYQNSVCLSIPLSLDLSRLWRRELTDPFGPIDRPGYQLVVQGNTQGIDEHYTRFGEVRLGGTAPTGEIWQSQRMPGMSGANGAGCPLFGLFTTGHNDGAGIILR